MENIEKKRGRPNKYNITVDKDYNKKYYQINKANLSSKLMEKKNCRCCDVEIMVSNMSKHNKTIKHKYNELKSINNQKDIELKQKEYDEYLEDKLSKNYPFIFDKDNQLTHVYDIFGNKWLKEDALKKGILNIKENK